MKQTLIDIELVVDFANRFTEKMIQDFISVRNKVFGANRNLESFNYQYINNIYGDSIIIILYKSGKPIGTQAFWRNDLSGKIAFQSGESATLETERGKGYFTIMVTAGVKFILKHYNNAIIYGFPNISYSLPIFIRMGWTIEKSYYYKLFFEMDDVVGKSLPVIDDTYAMYWLKTRRPEHIKKVKIDDVYYLTSRVRNHVYSLMGRINDGIASQFKSNDFFDMLWYKDITPGIFSRYFNVTHVIRYYTLSQEHKKDVLIPVYKIDAL